MTLPSPPPFGTFIRFGDTTRPLTWEICDLFHNWSDWCRLDLSDKITKRRTHKKSANWPVDTIPMASLEGLEAVLRKSKLPVVGLWIFGWTSQGTLKSKISNRPIMGFQEKAPILIFRGEKTKTRQENCGFCSNRILHYFPMLVSVSQAWHLKFSR